MDEQNRQQVPGVILTAGVTLVCVIASTFAAAREVAFPELLWIPLGLIGTAGLRWWQDTVNERRSEEDRVPASATVLALVFWLMFSAALYAMTRALWQIGGGWIAAVFVGIIWALASASVGGIVGFLFGVTRVNVNAQGQSTAEMRPDGKTAPAPAQPVTILENIAQWLGTALAGGVLFQAGNLGHVLTDLGNAFGDIQGMYTANEAATRKWLATVGSASAVLFTLMGFLAVYLLTKLFLNPAMNIADRAVGPKIPQRPDLSDLELEALEKAEIDVGDQQAQFGELAKEAAKKIIETPPERLTHWRDLRLYAKAKLSLGEPKAALDAYRRAIDIVPEDAEMLLGFAVALSELEEKGPDGRGTAPITDSARGMILSQLERARNAWKRADGASLAKNVYKSLIFAYLYVKPPGGFVKALRTAREYFEMDNTIRSSGILVNVACAYGQAATAVQEQRSRPLSADELTVFRAPTAVELENPSKLLAFLHREGVEVLREALARRPEFKPWVRRLARLDPAKAGEENDADLVPFKNDAAFLALVRDRPPTTPKTPKAPKARAKAKKKSRPTGKK